MKRQKNFDPETPPDNFALRAGRPASRQVYEYLRREILRGRIEPDTHLSEANLCHFFEISRQPVREALLRLSVDRLVRIFPQRGSVVTRISVPMVRQAQLIRESVEVEMLRRAIETCDAALLGTLETELTVQEAFVKAGEWERFYESDQRFHWLIFEHSSVSGVWEALESSRTQLDRVRQEDLRENDALEHLVAQHRAIFDGLAAGDPDIAITAMRNHIRRVLDSLSRAQARRPDHFEDIDPFMGG